MQTGDDMKWTTPAAFAFGLAIGGMFVARGDAPDTKVPPQEQPLVAMNREFRAAYGLARAGVIDEFGPVILFDGETMTLRRGKERTVAELKFPEYDHLKAIAHLPFSVFLLLHPAEGAIPEKRLANLQRLLGRAEAAYPTLGKQGFTPVQVERSEAIFAMCFAQIKRSLNAKTCTAGQATEFARTAAPLCLAHAADAAKHQIDIMHTQVSAWRKDVPAVEWAKLRVVVQGGPMPRRENAAVQYFAKLLGVPGECERLVYHESVYDEAKSMTLLGAHQLDTDAGTAFFNDPTRLKRDLLCDGVAAYLRTFRVQ